MGFRDLHKFNVALLAKQAWRILQNPSSLLAKLYKGRYHNKTPFLDSDIGTVPSYGWRSLQAGKEFLKLGLHVQLGDGMTTNVWSDHWLPVIPPRVATNLSQGPIDNDLKVADLWIQGKREWNVQKLDDVLTDEDKRLAVSIKLSNYAFNDRYVWPYTKDGTYTVKSGYRAALELLQDPVPRMPIEGSLELKQLLWKLKIPPKIQHFIWKALSSAIPTADQLLKKHVAIDPICQRCCLHEETINHVLFECEHAQGIWRCANYPHFNPPSMLLEENLRRVFQIRELDMVDMEVRLLPFWIVWMTWKSRNEFLFNRRNVHPQEDVNRSVHAVAEWLIAFTEAGESSNTQRRQPNGRWEPPPEGWLKCNFDSSYKRGSEQIGVGWIVRDSHGHFVEAGNAKLNQVQTPLQAEANGFMYVVQQMWSRGYRNVWFEGDCLELTHLINGQKDSMELGNVLWDIRFWINKLPLCSLEQVNRERNVIADELAKQAHVLHNLCHLYKSPPRWMINYLYYPYTT